MSDILVELIAMPAVVLGIIALIGLIAQGKKVQAIVLGTVKTVLGVLIMNLGIDGVIGAIEPIQQMYEEGITPILPDFQAFVTFDEGVVGAVQSADVGQIGAAIAWTMLFGYIIHILLARITPFKFLYLTGHMIWIHAGAFAILFHSFGLSLFWTVALASIVDGIYMTVAPAIAQPVIRKITGQDDFGFAHGQTLLNLLAAWVGKLIGDPEDTAEKLKVPEGLNFFRDMAISISVIMIFVSLLGALLAVGQIGVEAFMEEISDGQSWFVFALFQALYFTAGVLVLLQGVRMLIGEIVPAFKGIGERLIPGSKPALDVPVIFPYAPNSLVIGLIGGTVGQFIAIPILALIGWPVALPSMIAAFFASGAGAIFGNATGGKRGAFAGGFIWCFVGWFLISFAYRFEVFGDLSALGASGLGFTVPDAIVPGIFIWLIAKLFGA